jgi:hypothetical protein
MYLGDFATGVTIYKKFTTVTTTGAPTQLAGTPVISVYQTNSTTQSTSGVTLTVDFDGLTGLNNVAIDTSSDGTFYATARDFQIVITTGTVGGTSVVGYVVGEFSLNNRSALRPATAGRTLVVSSSGLADAQTVSIGPTGSGTAQTARDLGTSVLLSSGTGTGQLSLSSGAVLLQATQTGVTIPTVTNLTNAPTNGSLTAAMIANVTTAATAATPTVAAVTARVTANTDQLAGQTVTAAAGVTFPTSVASPTNITAGTITTVTNLTNAATSGSLTAAMIANVTTAATAATPTVAAVTGAVGSVTGNVGGNVTGSVGSLALQAQQDVEDSVWDATLSGHLGAGSTGAALNAAGAAGDPWITALPGAYSAGSAGYIIGNGIDTPISSRASASALATAQTDLDTITGANGVIIASGTQTFNTTGNTTGNISGSVGSVTGAVGSVTGAVGSVTGAVGSVTGAVGSVTGAVGSVTGAVGSVTGNVGGNVTGSIGSLGATAAANVRTQAGNALLDFGAIP